MFDLDLFDNDDQQYTLQYDHRGELEVIAQYEQTNWEAELDGELA